jgi:hypothetical protein
LATLESELMPYFRELDASALRLQNQFRLYQVTLIFGAALATLLGALHANLSSGAGAWIGISETVLAAVLSGVAVRSQTTRARKILWRPAKGGKTSVGIFSVFGPGWHLFG